MKTVDLYKIFEEFRELFVKHGGRHNDYIISAMREACIQTLELAAENATIISADRLPENIDRGDAHYDFEEEFYLFADKQSILNTVNQIV